MLRAAHHLLPLLALLALVACSSGDKGSPTAVPSVGEGQPKRGGVLTLLMNQTGDPPSFDLHQESVSAAIEAAGPVYDNLIMYDPLHPTEIVPDLASSWQLEQGGAAYIFQLRQGVRFHNGDPLTSADARFSLERIKDPPPGVASPRQGGLKAVAAVETPDPYSLRLRLERPAPSLLANLAQGWMAMYSKAWVDAQGQEGPKRQPMGTGPFRFKAYSSANYVEVERNPNYWLPGRPYLDGVKTLVVPDSVTRLAALRTGQVLMSRVFPQDAATLQQDLGDKLTFSSQVAYSFGSLTMNVHRAPFDDPRVRQAVNLAIDRYAGVTILTQNQGTLGGYMTPGGPWSLDAEAIQKLPGYSSTKLDDLQRARALLAEAGQSGGFEVELLTRTGATFVDLAVFVADQLRKIGINARIMPVETAQAIGLAGKGEFALLTWGHEFALDDPDAVYGEFYLCGAPRNYGSYCNPELEALYQRQSRELDPERRRELVRQMELLAVPAAAKVITHWNRRFDVWWNELRDFQPHPASFNNARYRDVWLDR